MFASAVRRSRVLWEKAIRLRFTANDDFGLRHVGIEWNGVADPVDNPNPIHGEKVLYAGGPTEGSVRSESVLSPKREGIAPQLLTLRVFTQDYRPNSERVYSMPQTIHIMSAAQHVAWIAEQMKRWQSKADAIYERELALNEENRRLQGLSDRELAADENVRRLEQQAAAERDNSQRLEQAIDEGRQLVEQALRNENMRADQVARWAESLRRLQNVANDRMPALSRKLSELADNLEQRREDAAHSQASSKEGKDAKDAEGSSGTKQDGIQSTSKSDPKPAQKSKEEEEGQDRIPNLNQQEDSMLDEDDKSQQGGGSQKNRMTIPETQLRNPQQDQGSKQPNQAQESSDESNTPDIDEVVEDQNELLEEFRKARESMGDLMAEFENTTFIRRLKAASQAQLKVASQLNARMAELFGSDQPLGPSSAELIHKLSAAQTGMFEDMTEIQADLNAYQSREPDEARQKILDEMQVLNMRVKLEEMPLRLERRLNGDTLHRTEFWADTFDRWAEELVPPQSGGGSGGGGGKNPSLPPSIILEVMRLIDEENQLRDETRALHQARNAMSETETEERLAGLAIFQMALQERTLNTVDDVKRLPNASQAYGEEIKKLSDAVEAMAEASSMLVDGMTGDPAIAAETAAIEALLTARRNQPNSGSPKERAEGEGDGSESLANTESPFDILRGAESALPITKPRDVGAATTNVGDHVPEAYRSGLDRFRNRLRKLDQMKRSR